MFYVSYLLIVVLCFINVSDNLTAVLNTIISLPRIYTRGTDPLIVCLNCVLYTDNTIQIIKLIY